jgi:hypothetical protein
VKMLEDDPADLDRVGAFVRDLRAAVSDA